LRLVLITVQFWFYYRYLKYWCHHLTFILKLSISINAVADPETRSSTGIKLKISTYYFFLDIKSWTSTQVYWFFQKKIYIIISSNLEIGGRPIVGAQLTVMSMSAEIWIIIVCMWSDWNVEEGTNIYTSELIYKQHYIHWQSPLKFSKLTSISININKQI
jgi:hypothetical protein